VKSDGRKTANDQDFASSQRNWPQTRKSAKTRKTAENTLFFNRKRWISRKSGYFLHFIINFDKI